jgi:hypothetical protein
MLRWILLALLVVGLSVAVPVLMANLPADTSGGNNVRYPAPSKAQAESSGKVVLLDEPEHDFGRMSQFDERSHEFTIKNAGPGDLTLTEAGADCGCTVANFADGRKSLVLKPGASAPITVTFHSKDKSGKVKLGVRIQTSDAAQPMLGLQIGATIYPPLVTMPDPAAIAFRDRSNYEAHQEKLAITSFDRPDFKILEIITNGADVIAPPTFRPLTDEEKAGLKFESGYRIDVELKPSNELGNFVEELTIKTDHPQHPELRVPVFGRRVGAISAAPDALRLEGTGSSGGGAELLLLVRGQAQTKFEVASAPEGLEVRIEPADSPEKAGSVRRYRLRAHLAPGHVPGVVGGTIELKTDHPSVGLIKIPAAIVVIGDS